MKIPRIKISKMTIKDLKQIIETLPDDMPVMGSTWGGVCSTGGYIVTHEVGRLVAAGDWPEALILALDDNELL